MTSATYGTFGLFRICICHTSWTCRTCQLLHSYLQELENKELKDIEYELKEHPPGGDDLLLVMKNLDEEEEQDDIINDEDEKMFFCVE